MSGFTQQQQQQQDPSQSYTFTQNPRPIKSKYRDPFSQNAENSTGPDHANIMWDRRVFRGNTYAAQVLPLSAQAEQELKRRKQMAERQKRRREKMQRQREQFERQREAEDEAEMMLQQSGRKTMEIQTEMFLEEITDRVIEEDVATQTDPFMDRPDSPLFIPAKSGVDAETQIEEDLFDFDFEVEPILEVLVGKTLEQSMLEVMEEEEMAELKKHQLEYEQKRNTELAETQRLEAAELRRHQEKEHAKQKERERLQKQQIAKQKLASRAFARQAFANLEGRVLHRLEEQGFFYDQVQRQVETEFIPWIKQQVAAELDKRRKAKELVDQFVEQVSQKISAQAQQA
mmetsp:Transcript_692/g.2326  ORF Transcript_692/g.2326 Transcript_692/m.2326 type:complete len:344 (+) Transcript_692:241-1272(+)